MKIWQSVAEREASPVLLVCEEAHRYVPNSGEAQYEAAQNAIKRLAKEVESTESGSSLSRSAQAKSRQPYSRSAILGLYCVLLTRRTEHMFVGYFPIRWQG